MVAEAALDDQAGARHHASAGAGGSDGTGALAGLSAAPTPMPTAPTATATARAVEPAAEPSGPARELPSTPDRSTIQAVLAARTDAVMACASGAHGLADVDIVIAGSGRITTATVNGPFAGTPIGSCIARAVRGATFPPFSQARFEVTYPYHL